MTEVVLALAPVFLIIILGWAVRASRVVSEEALGAANRVGYFVFYPAFLFSNIVGADMAGGTARFLAATTIGFFAVAAVTLALKPWFKDGPAFTSIFQGGLRWNGFGILAGAQAIWGPPGSAAIALALGPTVLLNNVLCVAVLSRWGTRSQSSLRLIALQVAGNPLVVATVVALLFKLSGAPRLGPVSDAIDMTGKAALPLALLCVGAGIDLKAALRARGAVGAAAALKLLIAPVLFWLAAQALQLDPLYTGIAVGVASTPTAAASYTLAREMGGDAPLMAAIVSATTLLSFATMPIVISMAMA